MQKHSLLITIWLILQTLTNIKKNNIQVSWGFPRHDGRLCRHLAGRARHPRAPAGSVTHPRSIETLRVAATERNFPKTFQKFQIVCAFVLCWCVCEVNMRCAGGCWLALLVLAAVAAQDTRHLSGRSRCCTKVLAG